jgi:hypothetical protein
MQFKDDSVKAEWESSEVSPQLRQVAMETDAYCRSKGYPELFVTDVLTTPTEHIHMDGSQHLYGEAMDLRAHHDYYTTEQLFDIQNYVFLHHWRRDVAACGRQLRSFYVEGSGDSFHIHLSVDRKKKEVVNG